MNPLDFAGSELDCERQALALAASPVELLKRLRLGARCLHSVRKVSDWRFCFTQRTLISPDGIRGVIWYTRRRPNLPISYYNQQTSIGSVFPFTP